MADLAGDLWVYNVTRVTVVDVTGDYETCLEPLPSEFYPVITEMWLPRYQLEKRLLGEGFIADYAYDWHEPHKPSEEAEHWYVGVVNKKLL
jgi:hypothetical protein